MHCVSCIRRYNALMNKVIWISGVTVSTRAKALVLTVTPLMHINLFISALYLRMHSTRALSYTEPSMLRVWALLQPACLCPWARYLISICSIHQSISGTCWLWGMLQSKCWWGRVLCWLKLVLGEAKWMWRFPDVVIILGNSALI